MNRSDSIKEIATALAKFQGEVVNPKNTADNPFFKSKYAPLSDILSLVRPLLAKNGLSVIQCPAGDGEHITINTILLHTSGEFIEADPLVLKAVKVDPQGAGSAITYGRRYALSAILGLSSEEDDDGNHGSDTKQGSDPKATQRHDNAQQGKQTSSPAQNTNKLNWSGLWAETRAQNITKEQVHAQAKDTFKLAEVPASLTEICKTQSDIDRLKKDSIETYGIPIENLPGEMAS